MKNLRYVVVLMAMVAMSVSYTSCSKDIEPDVDAKENFWFDFKLSNPGSLNEAAQTRFTELVDSVIYGSKGATHYPIYNTESYARENFNKIVALPNSENDIVQKIMLPVSKIQNVRDFEVSMTLSKDSMKTVLATKVYKAAEVLTAE